MSNDIIHSYEPLWGSWKVDKLVGLGSVGRVYKVYREEYGKKFWSAVKVIKVPSDDQLALFSSTNTTDKVDMMERYFDDIVKNILNEIELLYELRGNSNVVSYEDHLIKKVRDKNEWHILIRMEYVESLKDYVDNNSLNEKDIIKLGIDLCKALSLCHSKGILHRDIKEANIFIGQNGEYKLGDFSVSKSISEQSYAQTKVGTMNYMPPEIIQGRPYNESADIYSLGIVLYKLLNNKRLPFMPPYPEEFRQSDIEMAYIKRLQGESFPKINNVSESVYNVLLKACHYNAEMRFQKVTELKNTLENFLDNASMTTTNLTSGIIISSTANDGTINLFSSNLNREYAQSKKDLKKPLIIGVSILVALIVITTIISLNRHKEKEEKVALVNTSTTSSIGTTIEVKSSEPEKTIEVLPTGTVSNIPEQTDKKEKETVTPMSTKKTTKTSGVNLIKNGGAESGNFTSWNKDTGYSIDTKNVYKGKYSFKLSKSSGSSGAHLYQRLTIPKLGKYRYSVYIKTENVKVARGFLLYYNVDNVFKQRDGNHIKGTNNWIMTEVVFNSSEMKNGDITVYVRLNTIGTAYFDEIRLEKIIE